MNLTPVFEDYQSFDSLETARFVLLDVLDQHQIPYTLYQDNYRQDVILGKGINTAQIWVRLQRSDFTRTNQLFEQEAERRYETIPADYYLRELNSEELIDILKKPDEWSVDDYIIAKKLLAEAGVQVNEEKIAQWKLHRLRLLKTLFLKDPVLFLTAAQRNYYIQHASTIDSDAVINNMAAIEEHKRFIRIMQASLIVIGFVIYILLKFVI